MAEFEIGRVVETEFGGKAKILNVIGKGRQSTVYLVQYNSMKMALKWYDTDKVKNLDKIYQNIKRNVKDGEPNNKFLWCKYMTKVDKTTGAFGYFMEVKPDSFEYFVDVMNGYKIVQDSSTKHLTKKSVKFSNLNAMVMAGINIVTAFRKLHEIGKSYHALSDGGFFINTDTGAVLMSDCDTIAPYGEDLDINIRPTYKAPEVLDGGLPDENSDLYTLAVVLFKMLFRGDHMEGRKVIMDICMNEQELAKHYGKEAVFIYDPDNDSNRPIRGIHDNVIKFWGEYPEYIKDAFVRSFTVGKKDPEKRLSLDEWQALFIRLRSEILSCICGKSHFVSMIAKQNDKIFKCPNCGMEFASMKFSNRTFRKPLYIGCKLFECEINPNADDFLSVAGELVENKIRPGLIGIKNCSDSKWSVKMPDGLFHDVTSGKGFPVWNGLEIDFGKVQAKF